MTYEIGFVRRITSIDAYAKTDLSQLRTFVEGIYRRQHMKSACFTLSSTSRWTNQRSEAVDLVQIATLII